MTKKELYLRGIELIRKFVALNERVVPVSFVESPKIKSLFGVCGYYRDSVVYTDLAACAAVGVSGMAWSYPGYIVDRTPYGVVCHEFGHHIDLTHGRNPGTMSGQLRALTQEEPITNYSPNTNEWFAEIFRLFLTNPDLLSHIRPLMYAELRGRFQPVETRPWSEVLAAQRQNTAAHNKILAAKKSKRKVQGSLL